MEDRGSSFVVRRSWFVVLLGPKLRLGPHSREALLRLRTNRTPCVPPSSSLHPPFPPTPEPAASATDAIRLVYLARVFPLLPGRRVGNGPPRRDGAARV